MVFVRPSRESINKLKEALRRPRFGEYALYFSNVAAPPLGVG